MKKRNIRILSAVLVSSAVFTSTMTGITQMNTVFAEEAAQAYTPVKTDSVKTRGFNNGNSSLNMKLFARYNSGAMSEEGGSLEIVEYNAINGFSYSVSGLQGAIIANPISTTEESGSVVALSGSKYDVKKLVESAASQAGFAYGDTTSVAISPDGTRLAAAIQHKDYDKAGVIAVFKCNKDGTLTDPKLYPAGVQPDMVTFANNNTVLSADEGEPRQGYGATDPKGTVSILDLSGKGTSTQVGFDSFTAEELIAQNILLSGTANEDGSVIPNSPAVDLEPEYITVSSDGKTAYVSLQEANAIAELNVETKAFKGIYSVGYEDYSTTAVDLEEDGIYKAKTYDNLLGARMPDGIAAYETNGKTYILTANEGDAREWGDYNNEEKTSGIASKKIRTISSKLTAGLPAGKTVMFGGRSFSIFEVTSTGLQLVKDSGSDFEAKTAEYLPGYFNSSNDDNDVDSRSQKKGPEPENVTVGKVGDKTYAFIALERIGGIMAYDITDPASASFANYVNSRDFSEKIQGDVSPEGLCIAKDKDGNPVLLAACEVSGTLAAYQLYEPKNDIVVLYTNDAHNAYEKITDEKSGKDKVLGYASIADYVKEMETDGNDVELVDAGDAIQGDVIGAISKGSYIVDIMKQTGYTIAVPGNHEFDYGMDTFLKLAENAAKDTNSSAEVDNSYKYVSCNFMDLTKDKTVFQPYEMVDYGTKKVAYVGITTPESITKSTPIYFQNEKGEYVYGFCSGNNGKELYTKVQESVDAAKAAGADYVVAIGHIGTDPTSSPWTSKEIIANTTGINAFLDGHSHSTIASEKVLDKNKKEVLLSSTGTKLASLGKLTIDENGNFSSELVTEIPGQDAETLSYINGITESFQALKDQVVASTNVKLVVNDPVDGKRLIRSQETNLGDLCADAYRDLTGADIAFVNGGGIRADINYGNITYGNIVSVHPYSNAACMVEATGQEILDALELGSSGAGAGESGGFLQVSGLSYEINTTIPSSVVLDDNKMFVKVAGEYRVQNVKVGNAPLDLKKTYKLASHNYMLKSAGDGYTMFQDNKLLADEVELDNQVLIKYITNTLKGTITSDSIYANTYGNGRIKVITEYVAPTATADGYQMILRGNTTVKEVLARTGSASPEASISVDISEGWNSIINKVNAASTDATVTVKMDKSNTSITKEALSTIKGTDKTFVLDMGNGIKWIIKGKNVGSDIKNTDMKVTVGTNKVPSSAIGKIKTSGNTMQISLAANGELGFVATLSINLEAKNAGKYANLYYYNTKTGKLEFQSSAKINEDGTANLDFAHASDYVISIDDNKVTAPNMGDTTNAFTYIILLILAMAAVVTVLVRKKRNA